MKQTMKLRIVERVTETVVDEGDVYEVTYTESRRVLQQWWSAFDEKDCTVGEWRDVPLEVEE